MTELSASLRVDFGASALARLEIKEDTTRISTRYAYARLFPYLRTDQVRIVPFGGTLERLGKRVEQIERDIVAFSGTAEATPSQWPVGNLSITGTTGAYDRSGVSIDFPGLSVDAEAGVIRATRPFWGWAEINYQTEFVLIKFDRGQTLIVGESAAGVWFGDTETEPPVARRILALAGEQSAVYEVPEALEQREEVYRVTSRYVVDASGTWEAPPGWPGSTTYPDGTAGPDPAASVTLARTHELATIGRSGGLALHGNTTNAPGDWFQPYAGSTVYRPAYSLDRQNPQGLYKVRADSIDAASLEADLAARFPGIAL